MFDHLARYYHTIKYLKLKQVLYQAIVRVKKKIKLRPEISRKTIPLTTSLNLDDSIPRLKSYLKGKFIFLNQPYLFKTFPDWNFNGYGKLWTYNLNYFDFLLQDGLNQKDAITLIDHFCQNHEHINVGIEPYPISIRGINWIKFFIYNKIDNAHYNAVLFGHYNFLRKNIEYHLMGNHLLENGFSLLFAAYYFDDLNFYKTAKRILHNELKEQILKDGAHFELSPMYHSILTFRILDCINLLKRNSLFSDQHFLHFLEAKASLMLGWLKAITFSNGDVPMVNDSAYEIAPSPTSIIQYAKRIGINIQESTLSDSGYRMIQFNNAELFIDIGNIGPDYIPGHAHSDTFSFVLYVDGQPLFIDQATSTYEPGTKRNIERSTQSHNTVTVNDQNQSDVWAGFRVGKRAKIINSQEGSNFLAATHDGYSSLGIDHHRRWEWYDNQIVIIDQVNGNESYGCVARIHFHPDVEIHCKSSSIEVGSCIIQFDDQSTWSIDDYEFALGFNKRTIAKVLQIQFLKCLKTVIHLPNRAN